MVLTHAHPDHVGGAVNAQGRPTFPNARYVISEAEWEFWTGPSPDLNSLKLPRDVKASLRCAARRGFMPAAHRASA